MLIALIIVLFVVVFGLAIVAHSEIAAVNQALRRELGNAQDRITKLNNDLATLAAPFAEKVDTLERRVEQVSGAVDESSLSFIDLTQTVETCLGELSEKLDYFEEFHQRLIEWAEEVGGEPEPTVPSEPIAATVKKPKKASARKRK